MTDRIENPWGERTPYGRDGEWPVRVDQFLEDGVGEGDVDAWVQTASILHSNGDAYDGGWKKGKPEGYGKYTEANGNAFYGMWQDGLKHTLSEKDDEDFKGYGTYTVNRKNTSDGETERCKQKWSEGRLLRERKDN